MTNKEYEDVLSHATAICFAKHNLHKSIDPQELVMQVYSDCQDIVGKPNFIQLMRRRLTHFVNFKCIDRFTNTDNGKLCRCNKCELTKPVAEFPTYNNKYTKEEKCVNYWCKSCVKKYHQKYYATSRGKKIRAKNFNKHVEKNREKWNAYVKARFEKEKEMLSDKYIKKILPFKVSDITQEMIENKRNEILQKRSELT